MTYDRFTPMHALILEHEDAPFRRVDMARPHPQTGQVLVRIKASSVNPLDVKIRSGNAPHAKHPLPAILGMDVAGIVEQLGPGVTQFAVGERVYGLTGGVGGLQGSLAEFAVVDALLLARVPDRLGMREAAALPLVFITAWEGLVDRAGVQAHQKVLIQGAGGVGNIAIQIARAFGAEVFATGTDRTIKQIERLGAAAIAYRQSTVDEYVSDHTAGRGFDLVFDTVGGATLDASFNAVRRFGHVVSCLGWGSHSLATLSFRAATYSGVFALLPILSGEGRSHHGDILREASRLIQAGEIQPNLDTRHFNLDTVEDAYRAVQDGTALGKIIIEVSS